MRYACDMYIDIVPHRKSPPAIFPPESVRQGKKITKRTLASIRSLQDHPFPAVISVADNSFRVNRNACSRRSLPLPP